ncbi:hypothetical protein CVS40_11489 [Lucilia cuprina]|nr:hypothetical protein CVS40_11489 [Lucilia cuprina]
MAPVKQCVECKQTDKNSKFIKCNDCGLDFHTKCAAKKNPTLTESIADTINKSKGVVVFKCSSCQKSKPCDDQISMKLSELDTIFKKELSKIISEDIINQLKDIKAEVASCSQKNKSTEEFVSSKINHLEQQNNSLRRQINRNDVIIYGLSENLSADELYDAVFKIAKFFNLEIDHYDINICTYIRKKKSILVKFNSVYKGDVFMQRYFKAEKLKLCDIIGTDIQSRIYINDNLTPNASKLKYLCRKLLKDGKIVKYKFFNKDVPEAQLFFTKWRF